MEKVKGPIRTCIGCRCKFPQKTLLRFVCYKGETLEIDNSKKLPGRGAYVCRTEACIHKAFKAPKRINTLLRGQLENSSITEFKQTLLDKEIIADEKTQKAIR